MSEGQGNRKGAVSRKESKNGVRCDWRGANTTQTLYGLGQNCRVRAVVLQRDSCVDGKLGVCRNVEIPCQSSAGKPRKTMC